MAKTKGERHLERYLQYADTKERIVRRLVGDLGVEAARLGQNLSDWTPDRIVRFVLSRTDPVG